MIFFRRGCVGGVNFLFFFLHNDYLKPVFFYLAQRGERRFVVDIGSLSSSPTSWLSSEASASSTWSAATIASAITSTVSAASSVAAVTSVSAVAVFTSLAASATSSSSAAATTTPAATVLSSGSVGVVEAKLNVQDLLLTVRSLGIQFVVLVLFVLLSQNILFICISFLPFGVEIRALTSLAQVERGAFFFGLLGLPLV